MNRRNFLALALKSAALLAAAPFLAAKAVAAAECPWLDHRLACGTKLRHATREQLMASVASRQKQQLRRFALKGYRVDYSADPNSEIMRLIRLDKRELLSRLRLEEKSDGTFMIHAVDNLRGSA